MTVKTIYECEISAHASNSRAGVAMNPVIKIPQPFGFWRSKALTPSRLPTSNVLAGLDRCAAHGRATRLLFERLNRPAAR